MKKIAILTFMFIINTLVLASSNKDYQFISPRPGSDFNTRESNIIIREGSLLNPTSIYNSGAIQISGTKSGKINGEIILSSDKKTLIFKPSKKFEADETVIVRISNTIMKANGNRLTPVEFSFQIAPFAETPNPYDYINTIAADHYSGINSLQKSTLDPPPSNYPDVVVDVYDTANVDDGYIFMSIASAVEGIGYYIMMLNNDGPPFFYKEFDNFVYDFKIQPNGYLSYGKTLKNHPFGGGGDVIWMIMDSSFTEIDSVQMGNGYYADCHDFRILANGHYLLFGYYLVPYDMSKIVVGGYPNALVSGGIIQELDQDKNVIFQWRSWDYYDFETFPFDPNRATQEIVHEFHLNTIDLDNDNHILISTPTWSKKINRQTGEIVWHIGDVENQFSFVGVDSLTGLDYIAGHTFYRIPNGNILLFDNGNFSGPKTGMAHEFSLDETAKSAELIWSYIPEEFVIAFSMGSTQRLPNGNTAVGWGSGRMMGNLGPAFTEVNMDGDIVYELSFALSGVSSYRAYRFPFTGGEPCADVIRWEVKAGNTYEFNDGPDANTGISIMVNSYEGGGYNYLRVQKYNYAPLNPEFFGKAPIVKPERFVLSKYNITSLDIDVIFDLDVWHIDMPESTSIYHREFEGSGLFLKLTTTYNDDDNTLTANSDKAGEFILARSDLESLTLIPIPNNPVDSSSVNWQLPVTISWSPVGYVEYYDFQLATDNNFSNLLVDEEYMRDAFYIVETLDPDTHYYWRVKAINDAGESEWTSTQMFTAIAPFVTVTRPNGGEQWQQGLEYFIQWDDNLVEDVILELYKGDLSLGNIDITSNLGAYKWEVDQAFETGSDYSIKVISFVDSNLFDMSDNTFSIIDTISAVKNESHIIKEYALHQNYPNPFNTHTIINYQLPKTSEVELSVFNLLGQKVAMLVSETQPAGSYEVEWDATGIEGGVYFYKLSTDKGFVQTKKLILLK